MNKHTKLFISLKKMCAVLLAFSFTLGMFSAFAMQDSLKGETQKIKAVKVASVNYNPFFMQKVWLEPNTEYVFSYLYSITTASTCIAIKGTNEKSFAKQDVFDDDSDYKRASISFTTTDSSDPDATMGTGENAGKIMAYVGIRNYTSNTAALNSYFAEFKLYKKTDTSATNIFKNTELDSLGTISDGAAWHSINTTNVQLFFNKAEVDEDVFKKPVQKVAAIKVTSVSLNPYFVQAVWLEPETEYTISYLFSSVPASEMVAVKEAKTSTKKVFTMQNTVFEEGDYNRASASFTTTALTDTDAIKGTGENAGKIMAYVGIRNHTDNTAAVGTYYSDLTLYKKSDSAKTNLFKDQKFDSMGSLNDNSIWTCLLKSSSVKTFYNKEEVNKGLFQKQNGVIKVSGAQIDQSYIGQWVELEDKATYYVSCYYTPGIDINHFVVEKDASKNNHFTIESITYDDEYLKATLKFTVKKDEITEAYARSVNYSGNGVLAYVAFRAGALDNGYIRDLLINKEGSQDDNLFKDAKITQLISEKDGGSWYSIDREAPSFRFNLVTIDEAGGEEAFLIPNDLTASGGNNVLKSNGNFDYLLLQKVSLKPGKNYKFSYYYKGSIDSAYTMVTSPTHTDGSIKDNVVNVIKDEDYYKQTIEFKAPNIGEFNATEDPDKPGNVIIYIGVRAVSGRTQYYYDFKLYESTKTENDNILLDGDFKYLGYKWKQRYYESFAFASVVKISSLEGGREFFHRVDYSKLVGDGTDYVIKVSGAYTPYFFQKVSLTPGVTYSFSFYHSNVISKGECYTGTARIQTKPNVEISSDYIESIVDDKEWKKTTTTFVCPEIGVDNTQEDPKNPGKVIMYVGIRYYGDDQYEIKDKPLYFYNFRLYETDSTDKTNILIDNDYEYLGETWQQYYYETITHFSRVPLASLEGEFEWFKKSSGPDIKVPLGDKMMSYGSDDGVGYLYINLPYSVKKNQTNGKYYILTLNIRPVEGREPQGFVISTYSGGTTAISPISVDGYTYKFFVQERYNFRLGIQIARKTSGYISNLEMYEADIYQNIIGKENVATAFGKNGTFADWDIQPGIRWLDISGGSTGLYPGELPEDYEGRTCGKLVPIPKDYFVLEDPGKWWSDADVAESETIDVGTVSGTLRDKSGAPVASASIKLSSMSETDVFFAVTDKNGNFTFSKVPVGGYDLFVVEDDGTEVLYKDAVWVESKGSKVKLSLKYAGNGINQQIESVSGGAVNGYIVDKNGNPIKGLTILLENGTSCITDENGYFEFVSVEAGVHSVYIDNGKGTLKIADIMVNEGVVYTLNSSDGSPLIYDSDAVSDENMSLKKNSVKNSNSYLIWIIVISVCVVALAAALIFLLIFIRKRKTNAN